MTDINPFQVGQRFETEQQKKRLDIEAGRRREVGINALADEFGPGAKAPAEFAAVTASDRAERKLVSDITQRGITNERLDAADVTAAEQRELKNTRAARADEIVEEDRDIAAEDRAVALQTRAARNMVSFFEAGLANGVAPQDLIERVGPALEGFGVTPEQIAELGQGLVDDPDATIASLRAVVDAADKKGQRRLIQTVSANIDGIPRFVKVFSDGTTEVTDLEDARAITNAQRVDVAGRRVDVAEAAIDPGKANRLAAFKKAGTLTAERVNEGLGEARQAQLAIQNAAGMIALLDEGVRTGSFAEARQGVARFFAEFVGIPNDEIATTDEFIGRTGRQVAVIIKDFGAGTGLSDADRDFANGIAGGNLNMDEQAIRRLVDITSQISQRTIQNYNRDRDAFVKGSAQLQDDFPRILFSGGAAPAPAPEPELDADLEALLDKFAPEG